MTALAMTHNRRRGAKRGEVSFDVSAADAQLIARLADRAARMYGLSVEKRQVIEMDVTATHANGCLLDLQKLLDADDFNFSHDVAGIYRHLDRETGALTWCFLPRCAVPKGGAS